jgi:hypothetical protein
MAVITYKYGRDLMPRLLYFGLILMLLPSRIVKDQRKLLWNLRWHAKIIHFAGSRTVKPWFKESRVPYKSNYIRNLKLSPWKDYKPVYACNTKQESYKLMIKRYARNFIFVFYALFFKIKG